MVGLDSDQVLASPDQLAQKCNKNILLIIAFLGRAFPRKGFLGNSKFFVSGWGALPPSSPVFGLGGAPVFGWGAKPPQTPP